MRSFTYCCYPYKLLELKKKKNSTDQANNDFVKENLLLLFSPCTGMTSVYYLHQD